MMKARPARSVRARRTPRRATAGVRSGGRSARIVAAVLDAAIDALSRASYAAVSIEDVAAAAGVNKTTVYRRWPTRAALVGAALARLAAAPEAADTGALESDLVETFLHATSLKTTASGRSVLRALLAAHGEPEIEAVVADLREQHRAPGRLVLERARRRGELPPRTDLELVLDVLVGAIHSRLRTTSRPLGRPWLASAVRLVLAGAAARPAAHGGSALRRVRREKGDPA